MGNAPNNPNIHPLKRDTQWDQDEFSSRIHSSLSKKSDFVPLHAGITVSTRGSHATRIGPPDRVISSDPGIEEYDNLQKRQIWRFGTVLSFYRVNV